MSLDQQQASLAEKLSDRMWRLNNLYWIENKEGQLRRLTLNKFQVYLLEKLHSRNTVLKARQLGISTIVAILMLDACLFKHHFSCGIVDKNVDDAKKKLEKALLAYDSLDYLPPRASARDIALAEIGKAIKEKASMVKRDATYASWNTHSSIRVGASMRGGSLQLLHVSELAYVAAHNPIRAKEIKTGALQAVSKDSHIIVESTHEGGRAGINYDILVGAMNNQSRKMLSPLSYQFFFFSWWEEDSYELDAEIWNEPINPDSPTYKEDRILKRQLEDYFKELEEHPYILSLEPGRFQLTDRKKAWYAAKYTELGFTMRQEYPSTPDEAFDVMAERAIYAQALMVLRANGTLSASFLHEPYAPFYVSWDLGHSDAMSIWLIQHGADGRYYVHNHHSASRKDMGYFQAIVRGWETEYEMRVERHFLPHDAAHKKYDGGSFENDLRASGFNVSVVPRISDIWIGIAATRKLLTQCVIHEKCGNVINVDGIEYPSGLMCLENYQSAPDGSNGIIHDIPLHDRYSHSADAFRTFAEAQKAGLVGRNDFAAAPSSSKPVRAAGAEWL